MIKGQTVGTTTDIDGNYFLEVPSRSTVLVFSYIGFEEQEVVVGNQININLNMREISTGLNEVVVVGYGSQKRASIVGSITTIEPQVLSQGTTRALSNNLAGNVAGVIAVQRSRTGIRRFQFLDPRYFIFPRSRNQSVGIGRRH